MNQDQSTLEEVLDCLEDMIQNACTTENGLIDSMALSTNADAIRLLTKHGRFEITHQVGRRIIGKFKPKEKS